MFCWHRWENWSGLIDCSYEQGVYQTRRCSKCGKITIRKIETIRGIKEKPPERLEVK